MRSKILLGALALILASCATTQERARRAEVARGDDGRTTFYRGIIQVRMPSQSIVLAEYPALVRRTLKPEVGQVVEEIVVKRPGAIDHHVVTYDVTGGACLVTEESGAFTGTCEMEGDPWRWRSWRAILEMPVEGQLWTVEREDKVTATGLYARRWMRAADGTEGPRMEEDYEAVSRAEFEALYLAAVRSD